jgi:uncharacterized protein
VVSTGRGAVIMRRSIEPSQKMICADENLSSLERQLALLYRQSWKQADEKEKATLVGTRQRFTDRSKACGSSNCMTTAYVSRLR